MRIPDDAPSDIYHTTLLYEKDGLVKEFTMDNYPHDDTTWVWVDTRSVLVSKGFVPKIQEFSIITPDWIDITEDVLADEGYTFLFVSHRLTDANKKALQKANQIASFCKSNNCNFYAVTSTPQSHVEVIKSDLGLDYDFCFTDEVTLKTIIRANPGLVLLRKGVVISKWHYKDMPDAAKLKIDNLDFAMERQANRSKRLITKLLVISSLIIFAFWWFRKK
jgi:hypothetical protein